MIFVAYIDDGIFLSPHPHLIDEAIMDLNVRLKIEDQGFPLDYVGVNMKQNNNGSILLLQPALIQSILKEVGLGPRMTLKPVPTPSQKFYNHIQIQKYSTTVSLSVDYM